MAGHHHHDDSDGEDHPGDGRQTTIPRWLIGSGVALVLLIAAWWLYQSGNGRYLFWGMALLCPLMHIFGHRGHGGHGRN